MTDEQRRIYVTHLVSQIYGGSGISVDELIKACCFFDTFLQPVAVAVGSTGTPRPTLVQ